MYDDMYTNTSATYVYKDLHKYHKLSSTLVCQAHTCFGFFIIEYKVTNS